MQKIQIQKYIHFIIFGLLKVFFKVFHVCLHNVVSHRFVVVPLLR